MKEELGLWSNKALVGYNVFFIKDLQAATGVVLKISVTTGLVQKLKPVVLFPRFCARFWLKGPLVYVATVRKGCGRRIGESIVKSAAARVFSEHTCESRNETDATSKRTGAACSKLTLLANEPALPVQE